VRIRYDVAKKPKKVHKPQKTGGKKKNMKCKICHKKEVQEGHEVCAECSTSGQEY